MQHEWIRPILTVMTISLVLMLIGISQLYGYVNELRSQSSNMEAGIALIPHQARRLGDSWEEAKMLYVTFQKPFVVPPQIFLAPQNAEIYTRRPGTFYQLLAKDVTVTGFTLVVRGAYADSFSNMTIDWMAVAPIEDPVIMNQTWSDRISRFVDTQLSLFTAD